jgi:CDP-glucose 4,6-dehydratase
MPVNRSFWDGRRSFVTGHTGFKGGWLATWLVEMGAQVSGYSLPPDTEGCYFTLCNLEKRLDSQFGDVLSAERLSAAMHRARPEIVFHLAAQPLVRRSYRRPAETFATNVMGTVNLLEAVRNTPSVRAVVVITSDKCYENHGSIWGYREHDPMGGHDPYSASKGCAELVTAAYQRSFFRSGDLRLSAASVRAGNVFGGGDTAEDRLVPDAVRALHSGEPLIVRNPRSVRPWQHVVEPLAGYLALAERMYTDGNQWAGAWNFGPSDDSAVPVSALADLLVKHWGDGCWRPAEDANAPHEARYLKLDCSKARTLLGWKPVLTLNKAVDLTMRWYRQSWSNPGADMFDYSRQQILDYEQLVAKSE